MLSLVEEVILQLSVAHQTHDGLDLYKTGRHPFWTQVIFNTSSSGKHTSIQQNQFHQLVPVQANTYFRGKNFLIARRHHFGTSSRILSNHAVLKESRSCPRTSQPSTYFITGSAPRRRQRQQCSRRVRFSSCLSPPSRSHACQAQEPPQRWR